MSCCHCGKPVVLSPSAAERAKKYGGRAADFTSLFPNHSECEVKARSEATLDLMRRLRDAV